MEAYLAIPSMGAIMHTVNIRLSAEQVAWVINHAENRVVILDASLLDLFLPVVPLLTTVEHILLVGGDEPSVGGIPASSYAQALSAPREGLRMARTG